MKLYTFPFLSLKVNVNFKKLQLEISKNCSFCKNFSLFHNSRADTIVSGLSLGVNGSIEITIYMCYNTGVSGFDIIVAINTIHVMALAKQFKGLQMHSWRPNSSHI